MSIRTNTAGNAAQPWYREPWPWILMSGPAVAVVAGLSTWWIAYATSDGLVAEDYYKQGLAVNRVLAREALAEQRGIVARIEMPQDRHRIAVLLSRAAPVGLRMRFAHATRPGHDFSLRLVRTAEGRYEAAVPQSFPPGHWQVQLEDSEASGGAHWRLSDEWSGTQDVFTLGRPAAKNAG